MMVSYSLSVMKVLKKDLKKGRVDFFVSSFDDLWFLSNIIEQGDSVISKTERKVKVSSDEASDSVKKFFVLSILVENVSFQGSVLRLSGVVEEGNDFVSKGSHHSFSVVEGSSLSVCKKVWKRFHLDLVEDSVSGFSEKVLIVLLDRDRCLFADVSSSGFNVLSEFSGDVKSKRFDEKVSKSFFSTVYSELTSLVSRSDFGSVVIGGPAFWKQEFMKEVVDKDLKKRIVLVSCSVVSRVGLNEVLKSQEFGRVVKSARIVRDSELVEKFMVGVSKGGLVCYGFSDVLKAVEVGSVESLIVTTGRIKSQDDDVDIKKLLSDVDILGGKIFIVDSGNEPGVRLDGLGGVGVFLRFGF